MILEFYHIKNIKTINYGVSGYKKNTIELTNKNHFF